jgi:glycosyltransferase involved in cell wall biosynthesis
MPAELTIAIPARNESLSLPKLLTSLNQQDYLHLPDTRVFVADANSTDGTAEMARSFTARFPIEVLPGGLPAVGRNAGARRASTTYLLFLDADVELRDPTLLRRSVHAMQRYQLHCLTTNIVCIDGNPADQLLFGGSNVVQKLSRWALPFATGMFMMFDRQEFQKLGGFNEQALFAEDYLLTKQVERKRFAVLPGEVMTSNRRFRKMGHLRIATMFFLTALNSGNQNYFLRDQGYWEES